MQKHKGQKRKNTAGTIAELQLCQRMQNFETFNVHLLSLSPLSRSIFTEHQNDNAKKLLIVNHGDGNLDL